MQKSEIVEVRLFEAPDENTRNFTGDTVEILNPKMMGVWQKHEIVQSFEDCPVCGKHMHIIAKKGLTWLAFCSEGCKDQFAEMEPRIGGLYETLIYFRKKRGI